MGELIGFKHPFWVARGLPHHRGENYRCDAIGSSILEDVSWGARFVEDSQSRQQKRQVFLAGTKGHEQKK